MHNDRPLTDIGYRTLFRDLRPSSSGCSVNTLIDTDLTSGQVIILPEGYDFPVLCFRLDRLNGGAFFLLTDKNAERIGSYPLTPRFEEGLVDDSVNNHTFLLVNQPIH